MVYTHGGTEDLLQPLHNLCRKGDFREEIQNLRSALQGASYQVDVDFGLPAASDAVKQHGPMFFKALYNFIACLFLLVAQ